MSRIRILPETLSNQIAAGEVIERPVSVVKELVENSIDAGATDIRIAVEHAGTRRIAVTDNGCGMDPDDVLLALEIHGTSKIAEVQDIGNIHSLGFRGEAIPSIASVSRFTMSSRTADVAEGTRVRVAGGKFLDCAPTGCAVGTQVVVEDLFYNLPARKKFLKSEATEVHHIVEGVIALALPYCGISFSLTVDGRSMIRVAAGPLESRLRSFFGGGFAAGMLPVEFERNGIRVHGYVAGPGFTRNSRNEQRTFVNGRAVESPTLYRGVRDGYATLAEHGRYSPCVLFVELDPHEVDVNVHPAKREVRFRQEFLVSGVVREAVERALKGAPVPESTVAELGEIRPESVLAASELTYRPRTEVQPELTEKSPAGELPSDAFAHYSPVPATQPSLTDVAVGTRLEEAFASAAPERPPEPPAEPESDGDDDFAMESENDFAPSFQVEYPEKVLGIFDATYLLCEGKNGLILVDQHAAHERILFEKIIADSRARAASQLLLIPQVVELPVAQAALLQRNRETFHKLGFDIESLGNTTVMLNALPAALPTARLETLLGDMLSELLEDPQVKNYHAELQYIARAACRAAIKAHDVLSSDGAAKLLEMLRQCRQGTLCPHGRPTMVTISRTEIIRRFGR